MVNEGIKILKINSKWLIIVASICYLLLSFALLIAYKCPATGYELSLYNATPRLSWIFIFFSFISGITILIYQIATKEFIISRFWLISLLILILSKVSLLYLPYIRGYISWRGDNICHVGLVKDILSSGHFAGDNPYPITHILLSQIIAITGVSETYVVNLSTAFFSVMYILMVYLLATTVFPYQGQQLLATVLSGGIFFGGSYNVLLMPNGWSIFILPLLFFCYFKYNVTSYRILFVILLVLYPFFHPLSSLIVIISLAMLEILKQLLPRNTIIGKQSTYLISEKPSVISVLIELVIFLPWVLSFQKFHGHLRLMWKQITTGVGPDVIGEIGINLSKVGMHGIDFIMLLFKMYGVTIIFVILSLAGIYVLLKQARTENNIKSVTKNFLPLALVFIFYGLFYLFYLLGIPGFQAIAGERILFYVGVLTPVFAAFTLYDVLQKSKFNYLICSCLVCLIVLTSALSMISLYRSPFIIQPNLQITRYDITGMKQFIEKKSHKFDCIYIMSLPSDLAGGILGTVEANNRRDISYNTKKLSDHFGYIEHNTLGEQYPEDKYVVIPKYDRIIYTTVWQNVARFDNADFNKLEQDSSVGKLYENGELNYYYVKSSKKAI